MWSSPPIEVLKIAHKSQFFLYTWNVGFSSPPEFLTQQPWQEAPSNTGIKACSGLHYHCVFYCLQNWNAYIGRLGYNDFCFNHVSSTITTNNISCKDTDQNNTEYGTVDIGLNFYLHQNMVNMSGLFYTTFHGSDVGAKIKGN